MMRICNFVLITIAMFVPALAQTIADTLHNDITLRTYIEKDAVPLNREVVYHVALQWEGPLTRYKISHIGEPVTTNLVASGNGSSNKINPDAEGRTISTKIITYYFKPIEMGMAYIDGVTIKYTDLFTDRQESLLSGRIGVKIIEPIPESNGGIGRFKLLYILLASCLIIGGVWIALRYKKRRDEAYARSLLDQKESPEEKYLRLLKETIHYRVEGIKESVGDLSRLLSGYFLERYRLNITGLSGEKYTTELKDKVKDEETVARIKDFYERTEKVKFAGEGIDESEFHRLYDTVELVLEHQKLQHTE
jgi:hypothetical protein